ncbi:pentatricopeptide repeat-containing protein At3g51320 [Sesamum indicum]|uniref:Pentatricopeptide repeat-containing protein At3g51320 n=1 Tax=Sesamum indicum TaxID=4182 RepID=A0A6I9TU16_SESIN|nr:pentatricopeptide repeat-containing protein At3g51320 [Sesamum indicum]
MAKLLRFRTLLLSQFPKLCWVSSLSSPSSSSDMKACKYAKQNSLSANIRDKALYLLNCCRSSNHLFQIQAHLITSGLFQDPSFSGRLLKLSLKLVDDLGYTFLIFKCISFPDAFCVNTVVKSYSCSGYQRKAVDFYVDMLRGGNFSPNSFTFPPLISACSKLGCLSLGQMCHGQALRFGVDNVLPVQNSLVHFYACCGLMDVAWKVFDGMLTKDSVSWNTIIDGFAKVGEMGLAHKLFDTMPEKNVVSWNVMMTGYLNFRKPGNALKLFREMVVQGFESNDTTAVNVIAACGRSNRLKEGRSVHGFLVKAFNSSSLIIDTALIDMYSKCGRVDLAQVIFNRMPSKNLVSWNAMILGHCINANPLDGLNLYSVMVDRIRCKDESAVKFDKDVKLDEASLILPEEVTFIGILCACARKGMLTEGRDYLSQMIDVFHVKPNFAHYWCMANLMANVGLMQEAVDILRNIPIDEDASPESSLWAGLFGSCRFQRDVSLAEQIAKGLIEQDPQNFSHHNLLVNIYAAAGRWEEVARTKELMKGRGIKRVPCCGLKDLKEIVQNAKVGDTQEKDLQMALME